jgi:nucleoside-triphosphatase
LAQVQNIKPVMASKSVKILLTGLPGCGKTTAVMRIIANLNRKKVAGFYTQEIRAGGVRKGFRWKSLDGAEGTLAHVDIKGTRRVGKYGVDVAGFERSVVPILDIDQTGAELFVIDEIGKMECFSERFVTTVRRLFASDRSALATVAQKGTGLISEVKNHPAAKLFNLTRQNRDETIAEVLQILSYLNRAE